MEAPAGKWRALAVETACILVGWTVVGLLVKLAWGGPSPLVTNVAGIITAALTLAYMTWRDRGVWRWGEVPWKQAWGQLAVLLVMLLLLRGEASLVTAEAMAYSSFRPAASTALLLAVTGPVRVELLCRGLVLRRLASITGFGQALAISGLLSGCIHLLQLGAPFAGFTMIRATATGILLGLLYSPKTGSGSLAMTMVAHTLLMNLLFPVFP